MASTVASGNRHGDGTFYFGTSSHDVSQQAQKGSKGALVDIIPVCCGFFKSTSKLAPDHKQSHCHREKYTRSEAGRRGDGTCAHVAAPGFNVTGHSSHLSPRMNSSREDKKTSTAAPHCEKITKVKAAPLASAEFTWTPKPLHPDPREFWGAHDCDIARCNISFAILRPDPTKARL